MSKSKRDHEKKLRKELEDTAYVFEDFIRVFQDVPATSKTFVKSGILYGEKNLSSRTTALENRVYKPTPLIANNQAIQRAIECAKIVKLDISKKDGTRKKSNLELLKEELTLRHSQRDTCQRLKDEVSMTEPAVSYFDGGDPKSTNLFLANLSTNVTETDLMEEFGAFGPLASVKIMWHRGEAKSKKSSTNCGFVAFMNRRDAERALNGMRCRSNMRVGWGKSIDIPAHPIYVPQELLGLYLPPPPSGLPFNAVYSSSKVSGDINEILLNATVKVTIPLNKKALVLINRMVEFVVNEGPLFEATIMNREIQNPDYSFLFDNKSATHLYYRWKLFSILQGDPVRSWKMEPFRMFKGGSIWLPPVAPNYQAGMPDKLIRDKDDNNRTLSDNQRQRLIEIIRNLTLSKSSIAQGMVFCLNRTTAINDSLEILVDSFNNASTNPVSKLARLYLLSDILANCKSRKVQISESRVPIESILAAMKDCIDSLTNEADKVVLRTKVLRVTHQLQRSALAKNDSLTTFKESLKTTSGLMDDENSSSDEPLDGASLLRRSMRGKSEECVITSRELRAKQEMRIRQEYLIPSKWDALDAEAQSTSSAKSHRIEVAERETCTQMLDLPETSPLKAKSRKRKRDSEREILGKGTEHVVKIGRPDGRP
ncbi:U2 snRNP-associated SURP motif-containing protein-like [Euwallacea fornicatus]|uniref:U2 snRNP-associated SURP motif-containing protein-like n=1 Tax=Euwallacea fornicatus TaxID=995702 RepID=UPI00338E00E2